MTNYTLEVMSGSFAICRLDADAQVPLWATGEFISISRTAGELSIVCSQANVPSQIEHDQNVQCELGWRCLRVVGPLAFSMVGVIASLAGTLAKANVSVFVVSTFETDFLFVKEADLDTSARALIKAGHTVST